MPKAEGGDPLVWAVDTRHLPMFWFPRDCPRGTFWARPETSDADVERAARAICKIDGVDPDQVINTDDADLSVRYETVGALAWVELLLME